MVRGGDIYNAVHRCAWCIQTQYSVPLPRVPFLSEGIVVGTNEFAQCTGQDCMHVGWSFQGLDQYHWKLSMGLNLMLYRGPYTTLKACLPTSVFPSAPAP